MRLFIPLILSLMMTSDIFAQTHKTPLEAYGKLPNISLLVISPNAERMAYRDTSNNKDVMVVIDILKGLKIASIDASSIKPDKVYFIDDDKLIFVVSVNQGIVGFKGRHNITAAYVYNIKSKKMHRLLTAGYGIYKGQTQLGTILGLSADKKFAFMPAYKNSQTYNLYRVSLEKQRPPKRHSKGTSDTINYFLGDNGTVLARERYNNNTDIHSIEALVDDEWQERFREKTPYRTKKFSGISPDKKSLVMISQDHNHGRGAYYTMSLTNGKISEPIFSKKDKDVEYVMTDIQRVVHGVQFSGFKPSYEFFDETLNARMRGIARAMPNNTFIIKDYTPDWKSIIFYMDGELSSGDYILYQNGALDMLASARSQIPAEAVHPVIEYNFTARDGLNIPSLITSPIGIEAKNLPAIMLPHGGPESYNKLGFDWLTQYFASKGYLVIQPQFRGSKGFGSDHLLQGRGEWGRKMQDDLTDAVNDLVHKGLINKDNVCIVGASYGGYAALAGAVFTPNLYKCVVAINGVSDIELMLKTERRDYGSNHWVVSYWQDVISKGNVKDDHLKDISPINHVSKVKTPILLIHGELDQTVPLKQSKNMYDELKYANKNVTFVELEGGDHYLSKGENRLKALNAIDKFIAQFN